MPIIWETRPAAKVTLVGKDPSPEIEALEKKLADPALYSDPDRTREMTGLVREQASLRAEIESLETQWLEASEALEAAGAQTAPDKS